MFIPDSRSRVKKFPDPESVSKTLSFFNPKNCVSRINDLDPDSDFFPIPYPVSGCRGQKSTGSRNRSRNTAYEVTYEFLVSKIL